MSKYSIILHIIILFYIIDGIQGCSCSRPHLQNNFCNADFVMKVRLRGEGEYQYKKTLVNVDGSSEPVEHRHPIGFIYNVKILNIYKLNENDAGLTINSSAAVIHTPPNDGLCKVDLSIRTKYLVTGTISDGELWIYLCSWGTPWAWITKSQKKYLKFTYAKNCDCKPMEDFYRGSTLDESKCYWKSNSRHGECYERHTACIIDKNSTTGGCKWHRNKRLRTCRAEKMDALNSFFP
ncbi:Metalloproteinase inhibitor 3 [Mactra antiquata]